MSRPVRIHIPGATYLIHVRAKPDVVLFNEETERRLFLDSMGEAAQSAAVTIFAFALMPRSILLFLRNGQLRLSNFVHRSLVGYLNRLRVHQGIAISLVQDRHREILVEEGELFFHVLRRVHLAPIIGGHWSNASQGRKWGEISTNRWTSFPIYTNDLPAPQGFDKEVVFQRFREMGAKNPEEEFYKFIIEAVKHLEDDILDYIVAMSLLGSPDFVARYYKGAKGKWKIPSNLNNFRNDFKDRQDRQRFKLILELIADEFEVSEGELLRPRSRNPGRKYLVELAVRYAMDEQGMKGMGERFHISGSALAHLHHSFLQEMKDSEIILNRFRRMEQMLVEHLPSY